MRVIVALHRSTPTPHKATPPQYLVIQVHLHQPLRLRPVVVVAQAPRRLPHQGGLARAARPAQQDGAAVAW